MTDEAHGRKRSCATASPMRKSSLPNGLRSCVAATAERDDAAIRLAEVAGYTVEGYCLRERTRVTIRDAAPIVLANGHRALAGSCPACGARVVRMTRGRVVPAST